MAVNPSNWISIPYIEFIDKNRKQEVAFKKAIQSTISPLLKVE